MDDLDRHGATKHPLFRAIHPPHATDTHELEHHVRTADGAADQGVFAICGAALRGGAATRTKAVPVVVRGPALMAQDHKLQDTPSTPASEVVKQVPSGRAAMPSDPGETPAPARGPGTPALCALGVNAWALSVGWTLLSPDVSLRQRLIASAALTALAFGAFFNARATRVTNLRTQGPSLWQVGARWSLLCVFPMSLSAALCLGSEAQRERAHSALSITLAAVALLAYGAAALQACRAPLPILPSKSHARRSELVTAPDAQRLIKWLASSVLILGALAIALIAPLSSDYAQLQAAWGDAADAGAALTAVVGGAIAMTLVAVELAPLLRSQSLPRVPANKRRARIAVMLLLTCLGGITYLLAL